MSGKLILVGTPIGNLGDFSSRAIEALRECDFIAAEDTRVTLKLLNKFDIKAPMVSYFEHNRKEKGKYIIKRMLDGEDCVLVTDAGMPAISDPGEELVAQCAENGIHVTVVPGPSAVVTALAVSGLPTGRFTFEGFLSVNKKSRVEHLESVKNEERTMVFYEAPHKLRKTLRDMYKCFGDRKISLVRELTKIHEEVIRTTLQQAAKRFSEEEPKGEFVIVIEGAEKPVAEAPTLETAVDYAMGLVEDGMSVSEAAKETAKEFGMKKSDIYKEIIKCGKDDFGE